MFRHVILLLAAAGWSTAAMARCPPPRDADAMTRGAAIVTGRVVAVWPPMQGNARQPEWARLQVTQRHAGDAPSIVRLVAIEAGLYTPMFEVGRQMTILVTRPFGESGVTLCDARHPSRLPQ